MTNKHRSKTPWGKIAEKKRLRMKDRIKNPGIAWIDSPMEFKKIDGSTELISLVFVDEKVINQMRKKTSLVNELNYRKKLFHKKGVPVGNVSVMIKKDGKTAIIDYFFPFEALTNNAGAPEELRDKGVGAKALNFMLKELKKRGVRKVFVKSLRKSVGFYEKMGFKKDEKKRNFLVKEL